MLKKKKLTLWKLHMMEVDSQLDISVELGYISLEDYKSIHNQVCSIARQLSALRAKILA